MTDTDLDNIEGAAKGKTGVGVLAHPADTLLLVAEVRRLRASVATHQAKWTTYEQEYILPQFAWAESVGIDLRQLVLDNPGKNCSRLLFEALLEACVA